MRSSLMNMVAWDRIELPTRGFSVVALLLSENLRFYGVS